jgi:hypothetical protein
MTFIFVPEFVFPAFYVFSAVSLLSVQSLPQLPWITTESTADFSIKQNDKFWLS